MADTGKHPAPAAVANAPASTDSNATPESPRATIRVRTLWPHTSFDMPDDDVPEITSEGTMLTKAQLAIAEVSAAASGVGLSVEEVK